MNAFGYIFHQLITRLGLVSPRSYLRDATEEAILLAEAEVLLGKLAWQDLENVEDISTEYWNLRNHQREQDALIRQLEEAKQQQQASLSESNEPSPEITKRAATLEEQVNRNRSEYLKSLAEVQELINQSNKLYKRFNGMKLKLSVLKTEGVPDDGLGEIRAKLRETRDQYSRLARVIANDKQRVRQLEQRGVSLQEEVSRARAEITDHHRNRTRKIAETSKVIVEYSAQVEQLEKKKRELQKEIGKFMCRQCGKSADLEEVSRKFAPLLDRTRSLMDSIKMNYRLAEFR